MPGRGDRGTLRVWKAGEALYLKIGVESECPAETQAAHHLETYAIDQAELPPAGRQHRNHSRLVQGEINPFNSKDRNHVRLERSDWGDSDASLKQSRCLQQDIVGRYQDLSTPQQFPPHRRRRFMP